MKDRVRFGKYIRFALTFGDFVVLNLAFLISLWILPAGTVFASK